MEARNRHLPDWFTRIRTRQIMLPRFQRYEAWSHQQVTALLNTVLRGLPAGAVLTLDIGDSEPFISRTVVGAPEHGERVTEHLLDGQQRLTALWRSLTGNYGDRSYFVKLERDEDTGAPYQAESFARWQSGGQRYPVWADQPAAQWERALIPIELLRPDGTAEAALKEWAKQVAGDDTELLLDIVQKGNQLRSIFAAFNIPFLSLPVGTSKETALNVFIQMNTSASPLTAYDIVVAQVEAGTGQSLHDMADELLQVAPSSIAYAEPSDIMLAANALLQDKTATRATYLSKGFPEGLIENWDAIKRGVTRAVRFLEEERILDSKRLPTDVIVGSLSALWAVAPEGLDAEGKARTLLRRYLWHSCFTDRYERTSATRALADVRELSKQLLGNDSEPLVFDEKAHPLPTVEEIGVAGWPKRKDRLPRSILALSFRNGGLDFADAVPASRDHLQLREYHHLFPDAWLQRELNLKNPEIYLALNCALVTWKTNRSISDKAPDKYISQRLEASVLGEAEIRRRLESHLIPYDPIMQNDYPGFVSARAELMHNLMSKLCRGEAV